MNSLTADESDKKKTLARRAIKLTASGKPASMKADPVSGEDRAQPWYFTHT